METEILFEPYPSDLLKIREVLAKIPGEGTVMDLGDWASEVEDRFAEAGYRVEVDGFSADNDPNNFFVPRLTFVDRITPEPEFDHDKMRHEVQHDILGISQPGAVTADGTWIEPSTSTSMSTPEKPAAE